MGAGGASLLPALFFVDAALRPPRGAPAFLRSRVGTPKHRGRTAGSAHAQGQCIGTTNFMRG